MHEIHTFRILQDFETNIMQGTATTNGWKTRMKSFSLQLQKLRCQMAERTVLLASDDMHGHLSNDTPTSIEHFVQCHSADGTKIQNKLVPNRIHAFKTLYSTPQTYTGSSYTNPEIHGYTCMIFFLLKQFRYFDFSFNHPLKRTYMSKIYCI
jgi:hypothetical protein